MTAFSYMYMYMYFDLALLNREGKQETGNRPTANNIRILTTKDYMYYKCACANINVDVSAKLRKLEHPSQFSTI